MPSTWFRKAFAQAPDSYFFFFLSFAVFLAFLLPDFFAGDGLDFLGRFLGGGDDPGGGPSTMLFRFFP